MRVYASIHTGRAVVTELASYTYLGVSLNVKSSPAELNTCKQSDNRKTLINFGCGRMRYHALTRVHVLQELH